MSAAAAVRLEGRAPRELARLWGVPEVELLASAGSTNDVARALAESGAAAGTVVLADEQTGGRGTHGRGWSSPPGVGVWMSVVLRPAAGVAPLLVPLRAGLAAARVLAPFAAPAGIGIKWPNDLLARGRKLAGILCETSWDGEEPRFVVVGIGVNVAQGEDDFPPLLRGSATSLQLVSGSAVSRAGVAGALAAALAALGGLERPTLSAEEMREMDERDALRGRRVVREGAGTALRDALALGVAPSGALLLRDDAGRLREVTSGSVRFAEGVDA